MTKHIVILGAGISGLSTAWYLKHYLGSSIKLTILEKSDRVGGWLQTIQNEDFLFDQGPRSCRSKGTGHETLALLEALGLQDQIIIPHSDARFRYIYDQNQLQRLPSRFWEIPFASVTRGWGKAIWNDWYNPKREEDDESISSFFSRRMGPSWVERLIDPFVLGIYAGDCSKLSMKSCFPLFDQWEQEHGSLLRGSFKHRSPKYNQTPFLRTMRKTSLFSLKEGMEKLPLTLGEKLREEICFNQAAKRLTFHSSNIQIELDNGQSLSADHVISTLPTYAISPLLASYPHLSSLLNQLEYASLWVVNFGFYQSVLPLKGFGYLIPSKLGSSVMGCVWDSCVFPQQNKTDCQTRLTVMMRGSSFPETNPFSSRDILDYSQEALKSHMGLTQQPDFIRVKKADRAIPQYHVGYSKWKESILLSVKKMTPLLSLSGSAFTGVSVNDCIAHAHQLARQWKC